MSGQITVGGNGGSGNDAGAVTVTSDDLIQTSGIGAHGILAQSIGGGGGTGGNGVIGTEGLFPNPLPVGPEVLLVPIGHVGFFKNLVIAVGGSGGGAGNGDEVAVVNNGEIVVSGNTSWGIFAQSIGGGGGSAGNAVAGLTGTVGIGGGAFDSILGIDSSSGDGGAVTVTNSASASISSSGVAFAGGIFAQSIGGGGGQGGAGSGLINIGGKGGSAGSGGAVTVTNAAVIRTSGIFSDGVLAQSVGGGGGTGGGDGTLSLLAIGGSGGSSGDGGSVGVTNAGSITTSGVASNGVSAQSIGGGGGKGGGDLGVGLVTVGGAAGSSGHGGAVTVANSAGASSASSPSRSVAAAVSAARPPASWRSAAVAPVVVMAEQSTSGMPQPSAPSGTTQVPSLLSPSAAAVVWPRARPVWLPSAATPVQVAMVEQLPSTAVAASRRVEPTPTAYSPSLSAAAAASSTISRAPCPSCGLREARAPRVRRGGWRSPRTATSPPRVPTRSPSWRRAKAARGMVTSSSTSWAVR